MKRSLEGAENGTDASLPSCLAQGTTAHLARIAPHTVLTLVMNEVYLVSRRHTVGRAAEREELGTLTNCLLSCSHRDGTHKQRVDKEQYQRHKCNVEHT